MTDDGRASVMIRERRSKAAWRLIGCLTIFAAGIWCCWTVPEHRLAFVVATGVFAVFSLRFAWSLARPGSLRLSAQGIEQDLGWRREVWPWDTIGEIGLDYAANGWTQAVSLRVKGRRQRVRLFGWSHDPAELKRLIDGFRFTPG